MSDWKRTKLRGKIHVKHGFPFKSEYFADHGRYVVLTPGNFFEKGGFKRNADKDKCFSGSFPPEYLLKKGDMLVAMTEQSEGLLGSTAFVPASDKYLHNQRLGLITAASEDIDLEFIYHLFKTSTVRRQIRLSSTGSKVKHTSPERIYDVEVSLPLKSAQKQIARVLSTLDAKVALNNQINAKLEAIMKLLYDYWFVQFDFPMTATQAASLGRPALEGQPYGSSGGRMVHNRALKRQIPEGWTVDTLDKLGEVVGGTTPRKKNDEYYCIDGIPWITPKDLSNNQENKFVERGEIDLTAAGQKSASLKLMPAGTVLLSSRAPIGYTAIASNPLTTNQGFKSFVPIKGYGSDFIYQTLKCFMKLIKNNASGSTFKEISGTTLKAIRIPMPGPSLAKLYSEKVAAMSAQQQNLEKQNQELTQFRDWLLPMLMNGQVTVT